MMKFDFGKTVYIDASVASYLKVENFTNPSKIARQLASRLWLDFWSPGFEIFTSVLTVEGADRDHHGGAAQALKVLDGATKLPITDDVNALADAIIDSLSLPPASSDDARHIAVAAAHNIDYMLTWKFQLLDKELTGPFIRDVCRQRGYRSPETCTPYVLVGAVPVHFDEILEELREIRYNNSHDRKVAARLKCRGEQLAPLDVPARLEKFKEVESGWLDGEGIAPNRDGLDWLIGAVKSHFPAEETPTKCYLTRDGHIRMEWCTGAATCPSKSTCLFTLVAGCGATASRVISATGNWILMRPRDGNGGSPRSGANRRRVANGGWRSEQHQTVESDNGAHALTRRISQYNLP